jgi:LacI family transcriptional regulator
VGKKVTMQDVAKAADVSVSTVSLALRGLARVDVETRTRILEVAKELGYPFERVAPKTQSGNLGFLVHERQHRLPAAYYTYLHDGARRQALHSGCNIIFEELTDDDIENRRLPLSITAKKVDGVIIAGRLDTEYIQVLLRRTIPTVLLDTNIVNPPVNAVICDNLRAAEEAARHLLDLGHQRIGVIGGSSLTPGAVPRLEGYKLALLGAGVEIDQDLILTDVGESDIPHGYQAAKTLHERVEGNLTAVLCITHCLAFGVLRFFRDQGLAVPGQVSVMGFDDHVAGRDSEPPLTSMHIQKFMMGKEAAAKLIELLNSGEESVPVKIVVPAELSLRESTAQAPTAGKSGRRGSRARPQAGGGGIGPS